MLPENSSRAAMAFVLRCWQEPAADGQAAVWRFRLQNVAHGEPHGFTSLQQVTAYLQTCLEAAQKRTTDFDVFLSFSSGDAP